MMACEYNIGPGEYPETRTFGSESKNMTIGQRRGEQVLEGPGPGAYHHELADSVTKKGAP